MGDNKYEPYTCQVKVMGNSQRLFVHRVILFFLFLVNFLDIFSQITVRQWKLGNNT